MHLVEKAAERGSQVHQACAAIAQGLMPMHYQEMTGYVDSFRGWFRRVVVEVWTVEHYLETHSMPPFCGTPDLIVKLKGESKLAVVDLKTPSAASRSWSLQLAGYRRLAELNGYSIGRAFSLRLDYNGGRPKVDEFRDYPIHLERFIQAAQVWHFFHS